MRLAAWALWIGYRIDLAILRVVWPSKAIQMQHEVDEASRLLGLRREVP
jgi:hypothetical protein